MEEATLTAPAKINLHLEILGLREDGYHELKTLFLALPEPCDLIRVEPGHDEHFFIRCPERPELETTSNLLYRAWKAFGEATGFRPGLFVTLTKRIPMGGGLGGGSSNAASLLKWLNGEAGDRALPLDRLISLAATLGADVPFFLMDGPSWATGIGEKLVPADIDLSGLTLVLACPDIGVDTAWAFREWDRRNDSPRYHESLTSPELGTKNPSPVSPPDMLNDFEPLVFEKHARLRDIKEKLLSHGAEHAALSGSGASLFGLYRDRGSATSAARALEAEGIEIYTVEF